MMIYYHTKLPKHAINGISVVPPSQIHTAATMVFLKIRSSLVA
jgi:hypothetical protein